MIEIPVHDMAGKQVDTMKVDEALLGGEVRPDLLKQAYVRFHANRRQGSAKTSSRSETSYSTRKLYRQKGTGSARRGPAGTNIMRGGAMAHAKRPHSYRKGMPTKMRRLANRNSLLAKLVDQEVKVVDKLDFEKPSTKAFSALLEALKIDRTCLFALQSVTGATARSARNIENVHLTQIDRLNAFDVLNNRYLLVDKQSLEGWLQTAKTQAGDIEASNDGEAG